MFMLDSISNGVEPIDTVFFGLAHYGLDNICPTFILVHVGWILGQSVKILMMLKWYRMRRTNLM
jgi:hypothetical protein